MYSIEVELVIIIKKKLKKYIFGAPVDRQRP